MAINYPIKKEGCGKPPHFYFTKAAIRRNYSDLHISTSRPSRTHSALVTPFFVKERISKTVGYVRDSETRTPMTQL